MRRFTCRAAVFPNGTILIPIFFGTANFDAGQSANYSAWSLIINNGLTSTTCHCSRSGAAMQPAATDGTPQPSAISMP